MLILSRKVGERIVIGDDAEIEVTVLALAGNHVRLGINAPKRVRVDRWEVHERLVAQSQAESEGELADVDRRMAALAR